MLIGLMSAIGIIGIHAIFCDIDFLNIFLILNNMFSITHIILQFIY